MKNFRWLYFFVLAFAIGCANGNCRQNRAQTEAKLPVGGDDSQMTKTQEPTQKMKVYKYDGSLQCAMGKAESLESMQKELTGLTIFSAENKPDGMMRIQQCGTPTGRANVFEIERKDFLEAKKRGFKEWTFE